ncbi:hypothetical protein LOZ80_37950 [Paenibacillus sp. HWE-109]|uniref:hypothetical protein n=1 Tax=Paenibacillus sp. HWE-109 TaxID=1306526 RepID=UPI001EDD3B63|nr:hypothetical protein [Paenibacillus sp. HWE-109]UKS27176.1 hypothetical protein LOZ80_37950 [Paenibacillus sp. HWE-109]
MRVIKKLGVVISGPEGGIEWYVVGQKLNGFVVSKINNVSSEYEDHVHSEYLVKEENGSLIVSIENCPVIVEWMEIPES